MADYAINLEGVTLLTQVPLDLDVYTGEGGMTIVGSKSIMEEWVKVTWAGKVDVPELYNFDQE